MQIRDCKWYKDLLDSMVDTHKRNAMLVSGDLLDADFVIGHAQIRGVAIMKMLCGQANKRLHCKAYNSEWLDCDISAYNKWAKLHRKAVNIAITQQSFSTPLYGLCMHIARYRRAIYGIQ